MFIKVLLLYLSVVGQIFSDENTLNQISTRLVKSLIVQGDFKQEKKLKMLNKPLISTGKFTYHQHKGAIWKTLTPVSTLVLMNESTLLTEQGEQTIPEAFANVFKAMLSGDFKNLESHFFVMATNHETSWQIELKPKDELLQRIISTLTLTGDTELRSLDIAEVGGNSTFISFDKTTHSSQLSLEQEGDFEPLQP